MEQIRWHYTAEIFFYFSCSFIERWIFSHPPPAAKDKEATTSFMTLICLPLRVRWGSVVSPNRSGRLTHIGAVALRQTVKVNTLQNHCWKPETCTFLALEIFYKSLCSAKACYNYCVRLKTSLLHCFHSSIIIFKRQRRYINFRRYPFDHYLWLLGRILDFELLETEKKIWEWKEKL